MNKLDMDYQALLQDILDNGIKKQDRTGTGTISVFGRQIRHKMSDGFPLLTTKKMTFKTMATELIWFLKGDTNIKFLVDNNCHIWDGDAYKNYQKNTPEQYVVGSDSDPMRQCMVWKRKTDSSSGYPILERLSKEEFINKIKTDDEFANKWGELGPIYGKQWRSWSRPTIQLGKLIPQHFDQIANLIRDLKTNPDSRRLMVSAWNVGELDSMILPPCHYGFQVYTRELSENERLALFMIDNIDRTEPYSKWLDDNGYPKRAISLMWNQRSVDTFLGLPFNIASYGLLLEIIAKAVNMVPDELIGNLGDTHLYSNHIEQAKEQIGRLLKLEEKIDWVMQNTDVELENLAITERAYASSTPKWSRIPYPLPKLNINTEFWPCEGEPGESRLDAISIFNSFKNDNFCKCLLEEDLQLSNYQSHPSIKAPLSN